jgi:hypothetical protein
VCFKKDPDDDDYQAVDTVAPDRAKHDASAIDKLPLQHLPWEALGACAEVMRKATVKYPYNNWRKGAPWSEFAGSALRHFRAWLMREDTDEESGCHHLAHCALDVLFLLTWAIQNKGTDDRVEKE